MKKIFQVTREFLQDEEGVTVIEYALIAALIAVAVIVIVGLVGQQVGSAFSRICSALKGSNC